MPGSSGSARFGPQAPGERVPARRLAVADKISPTAWLLALAIVLCTLEGAGRKWLVPDSPPSVQAVFYFSKDVVLLAAALAASHYRSYSVQVRQFRQALLVTTGLVCVAALLSLPGATLVGGALSVRSMVVIPWLALFIAPGLRSLRDLELIVWTVGVLGIGIAVLGVAQFHLPANHVLNQQPESSAYATVAMGRVRASGTFAFISGMGSIALGATWAGTYLLLKRPGQKAGYAFILAGLVCAMAALSRSGFFFSVALFGSSLLLSRTGAKSGLLLALIMLLTWLARSDEARNDREVGILTGIIARQATSDSVLQRAWGMGIDLYGAFAYSPLGKGIGTGQQGEGAAQSAVRYYVGYETEMARIVGEIGVLGLLGVATCRISITLLLWNAIVRGQPQPTPFDHLRKVSLVAIGIPFMSNTCFNHVACAFAWITAAVALATFEISTRQQGMRRPHFGGLGLAAGTRTGDRPS